MAAPGKPPGPGAPPAPTGSWYGDLGRSLYNFLVGPSSTPGTASNNGPGSAPGATSNGPGRQRPPSHSASSLQATPVPVRRRQAGAAKKDNKDAKEAVNSSKEEPKNAAKAVLSGLEGRQDVKEDGGAPEAAKNEPKTPKLQTSKLNSKFKGSLTNSLDTNSRKSSMTSTGSSKSSNISSSNTPGAKLAASKPNPPSSNVNSKANLSAKAKPKQEASSNKNSKSAKKPSQNKNRFTKNVNRPIMVRSKSTLTELSLSKEKEKAEKEDKAKSKLMPKLFRSKSSLTPDQVEEYKASKKDESLSPRRSRVNQKGPVDGPKSPGVPLRAKKPDPGTKQARLSAREAFFQSLNADPASENETKTDTVSAATETKPEQPDGYSKDALDALEKMSIRSRSSSENSSLENEQNKEPVAVQGNLTLNIKSKGSSKTIGQFKATEKLEWIDTPELVRKSSEAWIDTPSSENGGNALVKAISNSTEDNKQNINKSDSSKREEIKSNRDEGTVVNNLEPSCLTEHKVETKGALSSELPSNSDLEKGEKFEQAQLSKLDTLRDKEPGVMQNSPENDKKITHKVEDKLSDQKFDSSEAPSTKLDISSATDTEVLKSEQVLVTEDNIGTTLDNDSVNGAIRLDPTAQQADDWEGTEAKAVKVTNEQIESNETSDATEQVTGEDTNENETVTDSNEPVGQESQKLFIPPPPPLPPLKILLEPLEALNQHRTNSKSQNQDNPVDLSDFMMPKKKANTKGRIWTTPGEVLIEIRG